MRLQNKRVIITGGSTGIGAAVARHWGLDDAVIHMIRRLPVTTAVRSIDTDDDMLRAVASCAARTAGEFVIVHSACGTVRLLTNVNTKQ